jgi:energy-coupling factor transport system permease protein
MVKYLLVPLVISVLSKVDVLTISMESRAFGLYRTRSYMFSQPLTGKDKLAIAVTPVLFLIFYFGLR